MAQIKVEFPSDDLKAAQLFGTALLQYAGSLEVPLFGTVEQTSGQDDGVAQQVAGDVERAHPNGTGEVPDDGPNDGQPDGAEEQVDTNGVPFNPEYCGKATEPFYNSGPQAGQWKKRRGLDQAEYDDWYAGQLAALKQFQSDDVEPEPANTAAAFAPQPPADTPPPPPATNSAYGAYCQANSKPPGEFGSLMLWISELQAAGKVSDDVMNEARDVAGVQMTDLFAPSTPDAIAKCIDKLAVYIESKAGQ